MRKERTAQKELDAKQRIKGFDEVSFRYDDEAAKLEASRCLKCKHAPCINGCPVGINIPAFIAKVLEGDNKAAIDIIRQSSSLPAVCGRVCPQEEQCEKVCVRGRMEGPVAIGALERYVADVALLNNYVGAEKRNEVSGKVAIIGSGPSSVTAAADIAAAGADVTIYEAFHKAGGVLVYGIPEFRLPKELVENEIKKVKELGVKIELNSVIGKTITLEELIKNNDAVFIGSGAGLPNFMNIPGENLNGVFSANEYLTRVNLMKGYDSTYDTPVPRGGKVAVLGAGNVAMDAARTALRLDAEEVSIIYRRTKEEMPAREEEIRHAEEEGVNIRVLTQPVEILGKDGKVTGIRCRKCELGEPDQSGRRRPIEIACSEFDIECDTVIVAIGTSPNPLLTKQLPELKTNQKGCLVVDENMMTSIDGVYAGGDAVTGAATVILAMGAGKAAAKAIIERLKNKA